MSYGPPEVDPAAEALADAGLAMLADQEAGEALFGFPAGEIRVRVAAEGGDAMNTGIRKYARRHPLGCGPIRSHCLGD